MGDFPPVIAALATAEGGALAVVRLSGEGVLSVVAPFCRLKNGLSLAQTSPRRFYLCELHDGDRTVDEGFFVRFASPKSFTGEEAVELHVHGGTVVPRRVLGLARRHGARAAAPGEFTRRALASGRLDLVQAEAIAQLVAARTERAGELALRMLRGEGSRAFRALRERLYQLLSSLEVVVDYPEEEDAPPPSWKEELVSLRDQAERLRQQKEPSRYLRQGARVVIGGPPNVGKSSLFNRLLSEEKAIVSDEPGTTRDVVEGWMTIEGTPVLLQDTAGLGPARGQVEAEGVRRARAGLEQADLLLVVSDVTRGPGGLERELLERHGERAVAVWNKADLLASAPTLPRVPKGTHLVSCKTGVGIAGLRRALAEVLAPQDAGEQHLFLTERQAEIVEGIAQQLQEALEGADQGVPADVLTVHLRACLDLFAELTGEDVAETLLDTIFARFCVGK